MAESASRSRSAGVGVGAVGDRDAQAHPDAERRHQADLDRFGEGGADLRDDLFSPLHRGVLAEDHELVAAEPGDEVAPSAGDCLEAVADFDEHAIADGMAVLVVDGLEAVEVEEYHGAALLVAVVPGEGDLYPGEKLGSVGQPGEAVVERLVDEHGFLLFTLDGVRDRADDVTVVHTALDEVVLSALAYGQQRERLVLLAAEHHDRHARGGHSHALDRLEAVGVGESEVEQHAVERVAFQRVDRRREGAGDVRRVGGTPALLELRGDDSRLNGAVLDEQDAGDAEARVGEGARVLYRQRQHRQ